MKRQKTEGRRQKKKQEKREHHAFPSSFFLIPSSFFLLSFTGIFGTIKSPLGDAFPQAAVYGTITAGLPKFISNVVQLVTIAAGIWMFGNLLTAGFMYLTSSGETEKVNKAWGMIYQSLIGLLIIVAAFAITGVASQLLFGNPNAILEPKIFGPGSP